MIWPTFAYIVTPQAEQNMSNHDNDSFITEVIITTAAQSRNHYSSTND